MQDITTSTAHYTLLEKDLILCRMLENAHVHLVQVDENFDAAMAFAAGRRYAIIVDARATVTITKEAMEYAARPESYHLLIAQAIVVDSLPNRLVGNFIIKFHKPSAPTKLFSTIEAATTWIRTRIRDDGKNVKKEKKFLGVF